MTDSTESAVTERFRRLEQGDNSAARLLWERYFPRLVRLARDRLGPKKRRMADEEDVALDVFNSLCAGAEAGRFQQLQDRDELWRLLVTITRTKAIDHVRYIDSQKRGGGHLRGESAFQTPGQDGNDAGLDQFGQEEPTAQVLVAMDEQYQRLLSELRDDTLRKIVGARMQGDTIEEIAERLNVSARTVRRKLQLIRDKWMEEFAR